MTDSNNAIALPDEPAPKKSGRQFQPVAINSTEQQSLLAVIARAASDPTVDVDKMERLFAMRDRLAAEEARKQFVMAMVEFKKNAPQIVKDSHVHYTKKDNSVVDYDHASLFAVCDAVVKALGECDISHRWLTEQSNGEIRVTTILTHIGGHSESTALFAPPDDSGGKNSIQAIASTVSYLQRYGLLAATGTATKDQDDDARTGGGSGEKTAATGQANNGNGKITENQVADLGALITEQGLDTAKLLVQWKIRSLGEIHSSNFKVCCDDVRRIGEERRRTRERREADQRGRLR